MLGTAAFEKGKNLKKVKVKEVWTYPHKGGLATPSLISH